METARGYLIAVIGNYDNDPTGEEVVIYIDHESNTWHIGDDLTCLELIYKDKGMSNASAVILGEYETA
jgi:hypothetical protein